MRTFNIHEAKTHLSRLVDEAEQGESFVIAKAGKPKVKVVRIDAPETHGKRRLDFWRGCSLSRQLRRDRQATGQRD